MIFVVSLGWPWDSPLRCTFIFHKKRRFLDGVLAFFKRGVSRKRKGSFTSNVSMCHVCRPASAIPEPGAPCFGNKPSSGHILGDIEDIVIEKVEKKVCSPSPVLKSPRRVQYQSRLSWERYEQRSRTGPRLPKQNNRPAISLKLLQTPIVAKSNPTPTWKTKEQGISPLPSSPS